MSIPTSSVSRMGPTGIPKRVIARSTFSMGFPSSMYFSALTRLGKSIALTTKPALSRQTMGRFRIRPAKLRRLSIVSWAVCSPRITSTSCISQTGEKKWIPPKRSGFATKGAIEVIGIEEVLLAMMQSSRTTLQSSPYTCFFTPISSKTASMTMSTSRKAAVYSETCRETGHDRIHGLLQPLLLGHPVQDLPDESLARLQGLGDVLDQNGKLRVAEDVDDDPPAHRPEAQDGHLLQRFGDEPFGHHRLRLVRHPLDEEGVDAPLGLLREDNLDEVGLLQFQTLLQGRASAPRASI